MRRYGVFVGGCLISRWGTATEARDDAKHVGGVVKEVDEQDRPLGSDKLVLEISEVVPSLNVLLRMHWTKRRKLNKTWQWLIWLEVFGRGGAQRCAVHGKVTVRILRRSRQTLDQDNLAGSAKIVLDALKVARVIDDDDPSHVSLICQQELGKPSTSVWVTADNLLTAETGSPGEPVTA